MSYTEEVQKQLDAKSRAGKIPLFIPEILEFVGKLPKKADKIEVLQNNDSKALQEVLRLTFDPSIKFRLKTKEARAIPFEDMDIADYPLAPTTLFREAKRLHYYTSESNVREEKLKIMLSQLYSSLYVDDADLVRAMFSKKLPYKGITFSLIKEAFPAQWPEKVKDKEETKDVEM